MLSGKPRLAGSASLITIVCLLCQGCDSGTEGESPAAPKVILIIGDGMDDQQITIARNYLAGHAGRLTFDDMPVRAAVQVQTVDEDDPTAPVYVADSANSATGMSAGIVTSAGRIATTARTDRDVTTIMELAIAAGFRTGIVTTASVTDATPASFIAHISQRFCQGPANMLRRNNRGGAPSPDCPQDLKSAGGRGSIAEQIAASALDVVLGGGAQYFAQAAEGESGGSVRDLAAANGFHLIEDTEGLAGLTPGTRVLGLFSSSTMPVRMRGVLDAKAERIARDEGRLLFPEPFGCEANPDFMGAPTLVEMTRAALAQLGSDRSFMLMIESASIDKQSHLRRPCGQIGEVGQLDETLALVLEYADAHPETLVLVTADHGQAAKLIPETSLFSGMNYSSPGHFARVRTPEGAVMGVNYATNDSPIQEDHSGVDVPLFTNGAGDLKIPSMIRQADIFGIAARHLGLAAPGQP
jgi:alkaline phosphatase